MRLLRRTLVLGVLGAAAASPWVLGAGARDARECRGGQDCALEAVRHGEIRPLSEVLAAARAKVPGEVIGIELEREDGVWVYEIKILTPSGRRREVEIDARTLAIIEID